jgi:hypothetical protein
MSKYDVKYTTGSAPTGTTKSNSLAFATGTPDYSQSGWYAGVPDDGRYLFIANSTDLSVTGRSIGGGSGTMQAGQPIWWGTTDTSDAEVLRVVNRLPKRPQNYNTAAAALAWAKSSGYYTVYPLALGGSLLFNGTNQYLSLSPGVTFGSGAFTFEGWFNASNVTNKGILGASGTNDGGMQLYFSSSTVITSDKNGGGGSYSYTMGSAITLNVWHYMIYNRNANGLTAVYIDGVRCTSTFTDSLNYTGSTDKIGHNYQGYFPGYWTNMRMTIGTAVYDSNSTTQTNPGTALTSLANTKYLMLGSVVTTDSSSTQTVTNNNGITTTLSAPI